MRYTPNSRFANYVTNIAFHLSLSRGMCSYLLAIVDDAKKGRPKSIFQSGAIDGYRDFITTGRSLESRGLIWREEFTVNNRISARWVPTKEGKLVAELVRRSVLCVDLIDTKEKKRK